MKGPVHEGILNGTVLPKRHKKELIKIEGNWYFPPESVNSRGVHCTSGRVTLEMICRPRPENGLAVPVFAEIDSVSSPPAARADSPCRYLCRRSP